MRKQIKLVIVCEGDKNKRNGCIYLSEYFADRIAKSFHLERDRDILLWDFSAEISETVKIQIEFLLRHIIKNIKNNEERRKKLRKENEELKKENQKLAKLLEKARLKSLKLS